MVTEADEILQAPRRLHHGGVRARRVEREGLIVTLPVAAPDELHGAVEAVDDSSRPPRPGALEVADVEPDRLQHVDVGARAVLEHAHAPLA